MKTFNFIEAQRELRKNTSQTGWLLRVVCVLMVLFSLGIGQMWADDRGFWTSSGGYVRFYKNGSNEYNCSLNGSGVSDFNMGNITSSLQIKMCWAKVWGGNDIFSAIRLEYRLKTRDAATGPSFSNYGLDWAKNLDSNNQYWEADPMNKDIDVSGLVPGNYEIEFYFIGDGKDVNQYWLSNNSGNYHANFTIPSKNLTVQVNGTANGNTVTGSQSGVSLGTPYTITATPVAGYKFSGWTATSGSSYITIADASSPTTTVTFNNLGGNATVKATFVPTYGFIEGRFKVKNAARSTTTYIREDGLWQTSSTAIPMQLDGTNHRFYLHTYCTPAQLAELIGTQTGEGEKNPYFFVSASTASGSVTSPLEYWATSNSSNNDKLLAAGSAGRKAVRNTGGYAFTFMGNSTSTGYAIIYSDKDYIWYELEHDINYDANGGSGDAPTPVYFNNNTDATVGNNVYSRSGYKFKWWNKSSAGTGEDFYPGEKFNITANTDLYAVWEQVASGYAYWNGNDGGSGSPIDVTGNGVTMRLTKNSVDYNTGIKDYTVVSKYNGTTEKHADVLAMDAANEYLQIHFTDGSAINALELGTVHNGTSGTKKVTVIYSTTADFSSGEHEEIEVSIPNSYQSAKGTTDFSPSTPDKYFYARIYKSVSTAVYSYTGPSSGGAEKMRIYSIKAQKGCTAHGLAYGTATVNKTYGDAAFTNTLTNTHSLTVTYTSSDESVATVASNGAVTIKAAGSTTITATWAGSAAYCEGTASYTLNVAKKAISASLSYDETTLTVGDDSSSPSLTGNTDSGTVTWESSDEDVATVDEYGVVTAVGAGTATITATIAATDNYLGDEVSVEFTINPACSAPTSPSVSPSNGWIYVPGEAITLTASATGTDASTTYTWYKGADLATAKASGAIQAAKTSAQGGTTYSIASCTASDAYRYWCEISNGSGCEASASYDIKIYKFYLYDENGDDVSNSAFTSIDRTNKKISVTVALEEAAYTYQFKVTDGLGTWYGKDESTITSSTNYVNGLTSDGDNVGLTSTCGESDYTIEYYYNANNVVVTYPVYSVYTVSYDATDGTCGTVSAYTECGYVTLPTPTHASYSFDGWYTTAGVKAGNAGAKYSPSGNITLYAKWSGSCAGGESADVSMFDGAVDTDKPTKSDRYDKTYTNALTDDYYVNAATGFKYKCKGLKDAIIDITDPTDYTDRGSYTHAVQMNGSGASNYIELVVPSGYTAELFVAYAASSTNQKFGVNTSIATPTGSNCDTWNATNSSSNTVYTATIDLSANTTYYLSGSGASCYFAEIKISVTPSSGSCYTVTYHGNGATSGYTNDPAQHTAGSDVTVKYNDPTTGFKRTGYEFNGWNTESDASGTHYDYWDIDHRTIEDIAADVDLYAEWRIVINADNTDFAGKDAPTAYKDVKVTNGATLTITNATTMRDVTVTNGATLKIQKGTTVHDITVETGSTLNIAKDGESGVTLAANSLALKGGWNDDKTKYDMPRVYIDPASKITREEKDINFDIAVDNSNYYPIAVPFEVSMSDVTYKDPTLASAAASRYGTIYAVKTYNGANRANGTSPTWTLVGKDKTLKPGHGYILCAVPAVTWGEQTAVIRFPMKEVPDAALAAGELGRYSTTIKDTVKLTAYWKDGDTDGSKTSPSNTGWNLISVPYMSCYTTSTDMTSGSYVEDPATIITGRINFDNGKWVDDGIQYVTIPKYDFSEYIQAKITDDDTITTLLPGWCFFVQVAETGNLRFLSASEAESGSWPIYAPKRDQEYKPTLNTGIILTGNGAKDKTNFLISDKYSAADYEINADLEKMFGENGYTLATYSLSGETRLAYNAMSNADAANIIPIGYRAPADGEYTFSINPRYAENGAFEHVNLIDYETGIMTDLLMGSYTFSTERTQLDTRFALNVVPRKETPTDIENGASGINDANGPRKVLINDKMYIILDGKMYDATGKAVK